MQQKRLVALIDAELDTRDPSRREMAAHCAFLGAALIAQASIIEAGIRRKSVPRLAAVTIDIDEMPPSRRAA
jgi:hypothetical protein